MKTEGETISAVPKKLVDELIAMLQHFRGAVYPIEHMRPLSIAEAAKTLRCRRNEVEALIKTGTLSCIKRNGRRYILPSDLAQWLESESRRQCTQNRRRRPRRLLKPEEIDPALREFFD